MANKYANLVGTNKIKDEYTKINRGFDGVEVDINKLKTDVTAVNTRVDTIITTPISGEAATQEIVDARVSAVKSKTFATLDARFEETEQDVATHMADYTSAHGGIYHKNLLHNWDFRNPVNQRGFTSTTTAGYTIDRWRAVASGHTVELTPNGIKLTASSSAGINQCLAQYIENYKQFEGKTLTLSVHVVENTLTQGCSLRWNATAGSRITGTGLFSFTFTLPALTELIVGIQFWDRNTDNGNYVIIDKMKLEIGNVSTLANDPPADYGEQLALCQRYCLSIGIDDGVRAWVVQPNVLYFNLPLPASMRIVPSLERGSLIVRPIDISSSETGFTFSYLATPRANTLTIRATKTGHGLTDAILYLTDNPVFSADL